MCWVHELQIAGSSVLVSPASGCLRHTNIVAFLARFEQSVHVLGNLEPNGMPSVYQG